MGTSSLGRQYVMRIMHAAPMNVGVESGYGNWLCNSGLLVWSSDRTRLFHCHFRLEGREGTPGTPWFPWHLQFGSSQFLLFFPMMFAGISPYGTPHELLAVALVGHSLPSADVLESSPDWQDQAGSGRREMRLTVRFSILDRLHGTELPQEHPQT